MQNIIESIQSDDILELAYADETGTIQSDRFGKIMSRRGEVSSVNKAGIKFAGGYAERNPYVYIRCGRSLSQDKTMRMVVRKIGSCNGYDREFFETPGEWIFG